MQGPKAALKLIISHYPLAIPTMGRNTRWGEFSRCLARFAVVSALALGGAAIPCAANDTSASIDAGGLVFERTPLVAMDSEILYISPERIEVDYVFANRTTADFTTVVAFPLPDLDLRRMWASPSSIPFAGDPNFVGFRTWVDGNEIHMEGDIHATVENRRDVTNELNALRINLFTAKQEVKPETLARLIKLGAALPAEEFIPSWVTKTYFYWKQTFPARSQLRIKNIYSAGPFKSFVTEEEAEWCTDDSYRGAFRKLPNKMADRYLDGEAVRYVLKTGANWSGPIGDFTLKLDKAGTVLLSTCPIPGLSLRKEGNTFIAHATDYTPVVDLNILFVRARRAPGYPPQ